LSVRVWQASGWAVVLARVPASATAYQHVLILQQSFAQLELDSQMRQGELVTPAPETKAWEMRPLQHKLANASSFLTGCDVKSHVTDAPLS